MQQIPHVRQHHTLRIFLLILAPIILSEAALAATYYVSPTGTASWSACTNAATPCAVRTALTNAVAGDLVYFRGGTYEPGAVSTYEVPAYNPSNSGTAASPITFKAYPGETALIRDALGGAAIGANQRSYIIWDGFILDRNLDTGLGASSIVRIELSNNIVIKNCDMTGRPQKDQYNGSLISITSGSYIDIYNNKLHGISADPNPITSVENASAIWIFDAHHVNIYNNDIYDNNYGVAWKQNPRYINVYLNHFYNCSRAAVKVHPQTSGNTDFFIYQNVARNCGRFVEATDAMANPYYNLRVYNNTVYSSSASSGVVIGSLNTNNSRNAEVYNNIFSFGGTTSLFLNYYQLSSFPLYADNNIFYGAGRWDLGYQISYNSLSTWQSVARYNSITADLNSRVTNPLFVNAGGASVADYKLQAGSPARSGGRGGSYPAILGAYITGNEVIGYTSGSTTTPSSPSADTNAPSTPANVAASAISSSQINVSWNASSDNVGVTGYRIYRGGSQIGTSTSTTFSDTGLSPSTTYSYTVSAVDAAQNVSAQSISSSATTQGARSGFVPGTLLFQESFDDTNYASRGWYDNNSLRLSSVERTLGSVASLEFHFLQGGTTPTSGGSVRKLFTESDSTYISYNVKYSSNWQGSNRSYHPHEFMLLTNLDSSYWGPSTSHLTAYLEQNEGTPVLAIQDSLNIDQARIGQNLVNVTEQRGVAGCNGDTDGYGAGDCYLIGSSYRNGKEWRASDVLFKDTMGPYYKNNWHRVEAYFKLNSIVNGKAVNDGVVQYWFDGKLVIDHKNVVLRTGQYPNMRFNQILIGPWIGDGSPVEQTFWIDNLVVATSRLEDTAASSAPSGLVTH